jgi:dihydrofolate synthase/folylpolyglutamate synthase
MTYAEAIEWLLSFADFERSGRFQDRPDVAPMLALLERLGNPHLGRTTVHIAGSKGKGSVAAMVSYMLSSGPYDVGLYTSPHLYSYTERIWGCCWELTEPDFARLVDEQLKPAAAGEQQHGDGDRQLVTFDLLTALAFLAFREWGVEVQVLEVGLGGRVDSTNVFEEKDIAAITPISLEHTEVLGDTTEQIAAEKAAIITPGSTVVIAPQPYAEASAVIRELAHNAHVAAVSVASEYRWERLSHDSRAQRIAIERPSTALDPPFRRGRVEATLPLLGAHQVENAATALATVDALLQRTDRPFMDSDLSEGLASVRWPCRIEVLREDPLVIADGAHNRDSARRLAETLVEYFAADHALFVVGCGSDKDVDGLAEELAPLASRVLAVRSKHPRAMAPGRIIEAFGRLNVDTEIVDNVPAAVDSAIADAGASALICVAGSLFVAAEARAHVLGIANVG